MARIELRDQVALITGAARRVGRIIALELARQGVNILLHFNSADCSQARETIQEIKSFGVDAHAVQADLSRAEGVDIAIAAAADRYSTRSISSSTAPPSFKCAISWMCRWPTGI